jgi:hypothetical protein
MADPQHPNADTGAAKPGDLADPVKSSSMSKADVVGVQKDAHDLADPTLPKETPDGLSGAAQVPGETEAPLNK